MAHLVEVLPETLSEVELSWLDKYSSWAYDGESLRTILEDVAKRDLMLWRIADSPAQGLVGTRLLPKPNGLQLWLELLVGTGLLLEAVPIREAIHVLARRAGCTSLQGIAVRPGLARLYEKVLGVRPSATMFREELRNGIEAPDHHHREQAVG